MLKKFAQFLVILLALGIFASATFAETSCSSAADCETQLEKKDSEFQKLDKLHTNLSECVNLCMEAWDWSSCDVGEGDKKESCDKIVAAAKSETGKDLSAEMLTELSEMKSSTWSEMTNLQKKIESFRTVDTQKILAIDGQNRFENLKDFLGKTIDLLVKMVGLVAFVFLVVGGFRLLVAAGNDNQIQNAKRMVTYSLAGLAVALLAYLIVAFVQGILYR